MKELSLERLSRYRNQTFGLAQTSKVSTPAQALEFINQRGFIFFWKIKGIDFPSLWTAVAGDRPVPNDHDDPGHITWRWKDDALGKRIWYYAKVLRRKATFIALDMIPYFYALTENYGTYAEDHLLAYEQGRMTMSAKQVYEALLSHGPLHTIDLRRHAQLSNAKDSEFNRALEVLQADLKILPIGVAEAGAWRYAFIYDIAARYDPDLPIRARDIREKDAYQKLLRMFFRSVGAAQESDAAKLFRWPLARVQRTLTLMMDEGMIRECKHPEKPGRWFALEELLGS